MLGYAASRVIQPLCHSEKRSDGESAFVVKTKEQADSSLSLAMTGRRTFTNIGGPKVHGILGMKGTPFQHPTSPPWILSLMLFLGPQILDGLAFTLDP